MKAYIVTNYSLRHHDTESLVSQKIAQVDIQFKAAGM